MENPFEEIIQRLERIELLLINQQSRSTQESEEDEILNVQEAAAFVGEAVATIYGRTSKREIPHYKKGKKLYFKKPELIEWIEGGKVKTAQELVQEVRDRI